MTDWDAAGGYHYTDSTLMGFSHRHISGSGGPEWAEILFRPTTLPAGRETVRDDGYLVPPARFSHATEVGCAGYYAVTLTDERIRAELTATPRVGVHRYTFPADSQPKVIIDLKHSTAGIVNVPSTQIEILNSTNVCGCRTFGWTSKVYFYARFSAPIKSHEVVYDGTNKSDKGVDAANVRAVLHFDQQQVTAKGGISFTSIDAAKVNLETEAGDSSFDEILAQSQARWDKVLQRIELKGGSAEQQQIFYTALYHTMIHPNVVNGADGSGNPNLSTISTWDTFRSWLPLAALTDTAMLRHATETMINHYRSPYKSILVWGMIGYHEVAYFLEALRCGCLPCSPEEALEAMMAASNGRRKGLADYRELGFIPSDKHRESVSCVLEYAYDDWCIAEFAKAIGNDSIAQKYYQRSQNYVNVMDSGTKFFRARRANKNWESDFNPYLAGREFTEATAWQYRFFAPHDVAGLVQQFGGKEPFAAALDSLFNTRVSLDVSLADITGWHGQYAHGNEPNHNFPFLYNYIGQSWKTQQITRQLLEEMYTAAPDGICGNEDCGQLSAWYVLTSLGLYEACPGTHQFLLTTPALPHAVVTLANGKKLVIKANNPDKNHYIKSVSFNGKAIKANYLTYDQLMQGGKLEFTLADKPCESFAADSSPYSFTTERITAKPYIDGDVSLFIGAATFTLRCPTPGATIHYTTDGTTPTEQSPVANGPLNISESTPIKAIAIAPGARQSALFEALAEKTELKPAKKLAENAATTQGLKYQYFKGGFRSTADLLKAKVVSSGVMPKPDITKAPDSDYFGYVFEGEITVPESGIYALTAISDDGCVVYIDGEKIVDNDGSHAAVATTARVALEAGRHDFKLRYIENYEDQELQLLWRIPSGKAFVSIPAEVFTN